MQQAGTAHCMSATSESHAQATLTCAGHLGAGHYALQVCHRCAAACDAGKDGFMHPVQLRSRSGAGGQAFNSRARRVGCTCHGWQGIH